MKSAILKISPEKRLEMQAIVLDKDRDQAFALVKRLLDRVDAADRRDMVSHLDQK